MPNLQQYSQHLDHEVKALLIETLDACLNIRKTEHMFSLLQGTVQYLIPHEVMIYGYKTELYQSYQYESYISTRYVKQAQINNAIEPDIGLIPRAVYAWECHEKPVFLQAGARAQDHESYLVPFAVETEDIANTELKNLLLHGVSTMQINPIAFFCFSRVPPCRHRHTLDPMHAYYLTLLAPHLHMAMQRILLEQIAQANANKKISEIKLQKNRRVITSREQQVLALLHAGKTNHEIAELMTISRLTVKNHVHNIIKKLGVDNRAQAVGKAALMGMLGKATSKS